MLHIQLLLALIIHCTDYHVGSREIFLFFFLLAVAQRKRPFRVFPEQYRIMHATTPWHRTRVRKYFPANWALEKTVWLWSINTLKPGPHNYTRPICPVRIFPDVDRSERLLKPTPCSGGIATHPLGITIFPFSPLWGSNYEKSVRSELTKYTFYVDDLQWFSLSNAKFWENAAEKTIFFHTLPLYSFYSAFRGRILEDAVMSISLLVS